MEYKLKGRFLEVLSRTLDLNEAVESSGISIDDAKEILMEAKIYFDGLAEPGGGSLIINIDGASRGNPGEAGAGVIIKDEDGRVLKRLKKYLGITTNNMAEYRALIIALKAAKGMRCGKVRVFSDSELVVRQINGEYAVRNEGLRPLFAEAVGLLNDFSSHDIIHVERKYNKEADKLANMAIDERS